MKFFRTLAVAFLCCAPFAGVHAEDAANGFILLIDEDAPGAEAMLDGRFDEAAETAASVRMHADQVAASTVVCAALIAGRELDAADAACETAVELAQRPITTVYNPRGHRDRSALAMAYSNRAVLRSLRGDVDGAAADIAHAQRQNRYSAEVSHNQRLSTGFVMASSD